MRILQVVHDFDAANPGGTERYTRALATELAARHEVSVFTFRVDPAARGVTLERSTTGEGVAVITVRRRTGEGLRDRLGAQRDIAVRFDEHVRAARPDVVHLQHLTGLSPALAAVPGRAGIPAVLTLHDFWFLCPRIHLVRKDGSVCTTGPRGGLACILHCNPAEDALGPTGPRRIPRPTDAAFVYRFVRSMAGLRAPPVVIAPSRFVLDYFAARGLPAERIRVLPHGLDGATARRPRRPRRPVRFGFLGLVSRLKGIDRLLDAFEGIDPADARLDVHGPVDPVERAGIEARAAAMPGVRLHGPYAASELARILAALDVVVNPSRAMETFSFVTHEALAHGVPAIVSRTGAMPEAIRDGVDGYLVGTQRELRERIAGLIANPAEIERLGSAARPPMTLAEHASRLERIYGELTA